MLFQYLLVFILLSYSSYTDMKERYVYSPFVTAALAVSVIMRLFTDGLNAGSILQGLGFLFFLMVINKLSGGGFGDGDVYVLVSLCFMLGMSHTIFIMLAGLMLTSLCGLCMLICGHGRIRASLPFVPFLLGGYIIWLSMLGIGP